MGKNVKLRYVHIYKANKLNAREREDGRAMPPKIVFALVGLEFCLAYCQGGCMTKLLATSSFCSSVQHI